MSNQQGDNPPSAGPAGAYGPGHTVLGEPTFVEEAAPAALPPPATPGAPRAGAMVPATIFDANADVPPPTYPVSPYAGGTAPAAGFGPPGAPAPNAYGGPPPPAYPAPPPQRAAAGPSMIVIGLAAFAIIGGLTTFLALRSRSSSEGNDLALPTIDVPPAATVPSDPGPSADPTEPPAPEPPPVAVVTAPAPKPTIPRPPPPKPTQTAPTPTPKPTQTAPPPTPTGTTRGPVLVPRRPIPKTR